MPAHSTLTNLSVALLLFFCLMVPARGSKSIHTEPPVQDGDKITQALLKIIYAAPAGFDSIAVNWQPQDGMGYRSSESSVVIPGMEKKLPVCYISKGKDGEAVLYCATVPEDPPRAQKEYQTIKESLQRILPRWQFREKVNGDVTEFYANAPSNPMESSFSGIELSILCATVPRAIPKGQCRTHIQIRSYLFTYADLPKAAELQPQIPPCDQQGPFHDTSLTVVVTVKPTPNYKWAIEDAPEFFASALLDYLNAHNKRNITFKEANGVTPNLYFHVTMLQTSEGTQRNQVWIEVAGLEKEGVLFKESSGESPFTNMRDAFNHTADNMFKWFENGWHHAAPCLQADGSVLKQ